MGKLLISLKSCGRLRTLMRASALDIALIAAGVAGIIIGLLGALTGNPTVGEQKWYWLTTAIALLPLFLGSWFVRGP
jgi:hypothetical protein